MRFSVHTGTPAELMKPAARRYECACPPSSWLHWMSAFAGMDTIAPAGAAGISGVSDRSLPVAVWP
jgi:hypothetical protein